MIEDIDNNTEIDFQYTNPREHVRIVREIYPDRDLTEYFTKYSIDMSEDSINCFYGGTLAFCEDGLKYEEDRSREHMKMVEDRLSWLVEFEYTPKEIKEKTEEF